MLAELYHSTGDPAVPEHRTFSGITDTQAETEKTEHGPRLPAQTGNISVPNQYQAGNYLHYSCGEEECCGMRMKD